MLVCGLGQLVEQRLRVGTGLEVQLGIRLVHLLVMLVVDHMSGAFSRFLLERVDLVLKLRVGIRLCLLLSHQLLFLRCQRLHLRLQVADSLFVLADGRLDAFQLSVLQSDFAIIAQQVFASEDGTD